MVDTNFNILYSLKFCFYAFKIGENKTMILELKEGLFHFFQLNLSAKRK